MGGGFGMQVKHIIDTDSADGSAGIIAISIRYKYEDVLEKKVDFVTPNTSALQTGIIKLPIKTKIKHHRHHNRKRTFESTEEVLVVIEGHIVVSVYNNDGVLLDVVSMREGDTIIFLSGGHQIEAKDCTTIIETKLGPYTSRENDKYEIE